MFLLEKYVNTARCHCFRQHFAGTKENPWGSFHAMSYWLRKETLALLCYFLIVNGLYIETILNIHSIHRDRRCENRIMVGERKMGNVYRLEKYTKNTHTECIVSIAHETNCISSLDIFLCTIEIWVIRGEEVI